MKNKFFKYLVFFRRIVEDFKNKILYAIGAVLPIDMDPGQLMSVQTFNEENRKKGSATPGSQKSQQSQGQGI